MSALNCFYIKAYQKQNEMFGDLVDYGVGLII